MDFKIFVLFVLTASSQLILMESIEHRTVTVNGINMHIAEKGQGPVVLLLHGFPELWYTWRHQIVALAAHGYRAVAPDLRGYGDTDAPSSISNYTSLSIVGDLVALIDALGEDQLERMQVHVVGHDWGAFHSWYLCLFQPDRVKALINLSVAFQPRIPSKKPTQSLKATFGDDYYVIRFQEPGEIEAEFVHAGTANVLKKFLTYRNPGPLMIPKHERFATDNQLALPDWLTKADIEYYVSKYQHKGFTGGLNYYRAVDLNWELTAAWTGAQVKVPVKFIVGDLDLTYNSPGVKEFIHGGGLKKYVPLLEEVIVIEGTGHFINEEKAEEINEHIYNFLKKF
ncbi:hypothetical protein Sjap_007437 [Stephania japonica]|uniref:soluble epoxide hydrolase n=1 Tax=Stephania japonica TaxID=461633 RepID=A0AAP0JMP5_9MAGN